MSGFKAPEIVSGLDAPESCNLTDLVESMEKKMIAKVLGQTQGNQRKAAKVLGVTERILGYKIKKYEIISEET